jgi:hypothetical protein
MFLSRMKEKINSYKPTGDCPDCHGLQEFETPNGYYCNVCNEKFLKGEKMFACRKCDYDVCKNCHTEHHSHPEVQPEYKVIDLDTGLEEESFEFDEDTVRNVLKKKLGAKNLKIKDVSKNERIVVNHGLVCDARSKEVDKMHPFVAAVHQAYDQHLSLTLSPDHFWILILQGVSNFIEVNKNVQKFKESIGINFDGTKTIEIYGDPRDGWDSIIEEFKKQIKEHVGYANVENWVQKFSTTTYITETVMNLSLMDGYKSFFNYEVTTMCGIRQVKLLGTLEDWEKLRDRSQAFSVHGGELKKWIRQLEPILDNLVRTFEDSSHDKWFWKSIYKHYHARGSGSVPTVDGWITTFFPYHKEFNYKTERYELKPTKIESLEAIYAKRETETSKQETRGNLDEKDVPGGLAHTPFKWNIPGETKDMMFSSGFVGYQIEYAGKKNHHKFKEIQGNAFLNPILGWAVSEVTGKMESY